MISKLNPIFAAQAGTSVLTFAKDTSGYDWLCWADPFFPYPVVPEHVKAAAIAALESTASHYTVPMGLEELRVEIGKKLKIVNGLDVDPLKEISVVAGADAGLFYAMMPFITPGNGDEVLLPDPSYAGNFTCVDVLGAVRVHVPLKGVETGFELDIAEFEARVTKKTKMIVLTNPNNPTGRSYSKKEMEELATFIKKHDLIAVVDQAFEETVYSGHEMITLAAMEGMFERTVTVFSISKGMALCGYRVGYIVAPMEFSKPMQDLMVSVVGAPNTAAQWAALAAFQNNDFAKKYTKEFESRTKKCYNLLKDVPGIICHMPQSGYCLWVDISELGTSLEVNQFLAEHAQVMTSKGDSFGNLGVGHIRIMTGALKDEEMMLKAVERIKMAFEKMHKLKKG